MAPENIQIPPKSRRESSLSTPLSPMDSFLEEQSAATAQTSPAMTTSNLSESGGRWDGPKHKRNTSSAQDSCQSMGPSQTDEALANIGGGLSDTSSVVGSISLVDRLAGASEFKGSPQFDRRNR